MKDFEQRRQQTHVGSEVVIPAVVEAEGARSRVLRAILLVTLGAVVTSILAYVRIPLPFTPVPITGQTFGVMLIGILLGSRLGGLSITGYGLIGALGLPVFAGGGLGFAYLAGPTGGYLWGMLAGAYIAGLIAGGTARSGRNLTFGRALAAAVVGGIVAVYGIGVLQLALVTGMGWQEAMTAGAAPFLVGDVLKAVLAAAVAPRLAPVVDKTLGK